MSARVDDGQHVEEVELHDAGESVAALGWQTKARQPMASRTMVRPDLRSEAGVLAMPCHDGPSVPTLDP